MWPEEAVKRTEGFMFLVLFKYLNLFFCVLVQGSAERAVGFSAGAVLVRSGRLLCELWPLFGSRHCRISSIQALRHLLADYVYQPLEGLFNINVVLGTGLKILKT